MQIPYRINKIKTVQFASFPDALDYEIYKNNGGFGIESSFSFGYNADLTSIRCTASFKYSQNESLLLICEVQCFFDIAPEGGKQIRQDKKISVEFLQYMATIATGTARGIIHTKTEGTVLNELVLPPINLTEVITEPLLLAD